MLSFFLLYFTHILAEQNKPLSNTLGCNKEISESYFINVDKTKIKKLTGSVKADYVLSEVTDNIGCIATDSIIELGGDVLFLASDGIRPIQGTARIGDIELGTVSKPIQPRIEDIGFDNVTSVIVRGKSQYRLFYPKTGALP